MSTVWQSASLGRNERESPLDERYFAWNEEIVSAAELGWLRNELERPSVMSDLELLLGAVMPSGLAFMAVKLREGNSSSSWNDRETKSLLKYLLPLLESTFESRAVFCLVKYSWVEESKTFLEEEEEEEEADPGVRGDNGVEGISIRFGIDIGCRVD